MLSISVFNFNVLAAEDDSSQVREITFPDPGTTPDSAMYNVELFFEHMRLNFVTSAEAKVELEAQYTAERLAEMKAMIEAGDYEAAQSAADESQELLIKTQQHIEQAADESHIEYSTFQQSEDTPLHRLIELQKSIIDNGKYAEALQTSIVEKVETGDINRETAASLINEIREETVEAEAKILDGKEEAIEATAEASGVPKIEVELAVVEKEDESGITDEYKQEITETEIAVLKAAIIQQETELVDAKKAGEDTHTEEILLENAKLHLQICESAYENGDYGKAFGQFTAAEHISLNAEKYDDLSAEEKSRLAEKADLDPLELTKNIGGENSNLEELERYKEELKQKYPEKAELIEKRHEQSKRVSELAQKLGEEYNNLFDKFRAEGKTEQEIASVMSERYADEFRKAYGEEYIPPGFIEFEDKGIDVMPVWPPIGDDNSEKYQPGGGFVKGHEYVDPTSGYKYKFSEKEYEYTTPSGETYKQQYPEEYEPINTFARGDEVYEYKYGKPEGIYEYKYFATGYEVINPDGTKEAYSYKPGSYSVVGGGQFEHKPTGFEYKREDGTAVKYEYNPEFEHYIAADGKAYVPPDGTGSHNQYTNYYSNEKAYTYSYGGENWEYDPEKSIWTSSNGQTYQPAAITGAPVGHENEKSYTTDHGEKWEYDSSTGSWKSSTGEAYTPPPSSYYAYDSKSGMYTDTSGKIYDSKEGASTGLSDPSGKEWTRNTDGTWHASTGEVYNQYSGQTSGTSSTDSTTHYNAGGYYSAYYSPPSASGSSAGSSSYSSGSAVDSYGNNWAQNSDGTWTNQGGGTSSGSTSSTGYNPGAYSGDSYTSSTGTSTYSSGTTGSYSTPYSGSTTTSGTGTYSGSSTYSSGDHTGSTSTTSTYSAPSTSYSAPAPSSAPAPAPADSGGGGHMGMVILDIEPKGMTGYIIRNSGKYRLF